jgi:RNA polymerase sigma factor (sigma-70 family)
VDFEKLSPARGWERLFSLASVVRGLLAMLKLIALGVIAYVVIRGRAGLILNIAKVSLQHAVDSAWLLTMRLALFMAGVLALLGIVDFIYQKQRFEKSLRMTKQEMKEEMNEEPPEASIEREERVQQLTEAIERLGERERLVVTLYYKEDLRLKEISAILKLSESRISRMLSAALFEIGETMRARDRLEQAKQIA